MADRDRWRSSSGRRTVSEIVKKLIPQWKNGLHDFQLDLIVRILDGEDLLCCIATGAGKSALFSVPIIVLREMSSNPRQYPSLPVSSKFPVGLVITPTKGLAGNIVSELKTLDIPAFAYCQDTVSQARITNRNLIEEIQECKTFNVICVDPEHLRDKAWRTITDSSVFAANVIYGCIEEAHLINEWGTDFRPLFKHVGAFFRGRLPSQASIFAMSATIQPGAPMKSITDSLGMFGDDFYLFRASNERPNTQFIMEPLENGVGGKIFPQLLRYSNSGRKAAVHCRTIDDVLRVFTYLWKSLPPGPHRLRRIQMYHSLRSYEDNAEVLRSLDEDPECQVAIVTVAFANGLNIRSLLDSLLVGFPDDPDEAWQRAGRAGRDPDTEARAVVLYQPKLRTAAERQLDGTLIPVKRNPLRKTNRTTETKPMGHAKALILAEKTCYIAAFNRIYDNPPAETATLDCIQAKRRLPCSLCATRNETELDFPAPPLPVGFTLPKFTAPPTEDDIIDKKLRLTKPEREEAEPKLVAFGKTVYRDEYKRTERNRPKSSYFPPSLTASLLNNLLAIDSFTKIEPLVQDWVFSSGYRVRLYSMVQELRTTIISNREKAQKEKTAKQRATRRRSKKKAEYDSESGMEVESEEEDEIDEEDADRRSSPVPPPPKRTKTALKESTNRPRATKSSTIQSAAPAGKHVENITRTYSAPYRTSGRDRAARRS